jgi:hypothetical protein
VANRPGLDTGVMFIAFFARQCLWSSSQNASHRRCPAEQQLAHERTPRTSLHDQEGR